MKYELKPRLEISTALDCQAHYKSWLHHGEDLIVDGSSVERVDAAGIQLLAAMFVTAKESKNAIQLVNASDELVQGITVLGLKAIFNELEVVGEK
jgi:anti-anti-sigma regulatory factor